MNSKYIYNNIDTLLNTFDYAQGLDSWENSESEFFAEFDIPGFDRSDVEVKSKADKLTITVAASEELKKNGRHGFNLSYKFPPSADLSKTQASLNLGVLKISVPKKETHQVKEITVKVA